MDMKSKHRKLLGFGLFVINASLCLASKNLDVIVGVLGSTSMPFISFVIPGLLYYTHLVAEEESSSVLRHLTKSQTWQKIGSIIFAVIGLLFIIFYITI